MTSAAWTIAFFVIGFAAKPVGSLIAGGGANLLEAVAWGSGFALLAVVPVRRRVKALSRACDAWSANHQQR